MNFSILLSLCKRGLCSPHLVRGIGRFSHSAESPQFFDPGAANIEAEGCLLRMLGSTQTGLSPTPPNPSETHLGNVDLCDVQSSGCCSPERRGRGSRGWIYLLTPGLGLSNRGGYSQVVRSSPTLSTELPPLNTSLPESSASRSFLFACLCGPPILHHFPALS